MPFPDVSVFRKADIPHSQTGGAVLCCTTTQRSTPCTYRGCLDETNRILCKLLVSRDTLILFSMGLGAFGTCNSMLCCMCDCVYVLCANFCLFICYFQGRFRRHACTLVIGTLVNSIDYDVDALIMDASRWKGEKALIYTHRFPGVFIGLAKCHYAAGGEVMDCNKL